MQTTLLSIAIVIILALVAALVGPLLVDWSLYRAEFEARASRLTGLEFRVTGPIDVRLLPTPTIDLQGIEFGRPGDSSKVRARTLHIEFALGRLLQGEWRIEDARLEGPEFGIGLDRAGRLDWPVPTIGFAPEAVSIQHLGIKDGRATLADEASGSRLVLDKIDFKGEVRSLAGPVKGEGVFVTGGHHYRYRISMGRMANDGGVKVRLNIDPIDRPLAVETELSLRVDGGRLRGEGSIAFAPPADRGPGAGLSVSPWRLTSRVKGDSSAAVLEQIELQLGSDDRSIKLRGDARLTFGSHPQLDAVLSSPQLDLDRVLSLPEETRRRPLVAIRTLADSFSGPHAPQFPIKLGLSVETLTLAGASLARVSGNVSTEGDIWVIENLHLRAPGSTQIRVSGRFDPTSKGIAFKGPAKIDCGDPRVFVAWLSDRVDPQAIAAGPLRLSGDIALGSERIAIEALNAEVDRMTVHGGFAYSWTGADRPARLDAALTAPEINIDRAHALAKAILGDTEFDRPREGSLSLKIGSASIGGVEVKQSDVRMRIDSDGLEIEQLAVADFAGAALAAKGRIDTRGQTPRGAVTLDFEAHSLDGVAALTEKFAAPAADQLRRLASRVTPVVLRASLALDPAAAGSAGTNATARFKIDGRAGRFRVALQGDSGVASDAFKTDDLTTLGAAKVNLTGRLEADDAGAIINLIGLESFIVADKRPGLLRVSAKGPLDGELAVDGQFAAGELNISTTGTVGISNGARPTAGLAIRIANANVPSPQTLAQGRAPELLPASLSFRLALTEGTLRLTDIKGTVAGTNVGGRLSIGMQQQPISFDGDFDVGLWHLPTVISTTLGIPATGSSAAPAGFWPSEPFEPRLHGVTGQIAVKASRVVLTPRLAARDFQGRLHFGESQLALQVIDGSVAGGRITGELVFLREAAGLIARTRLRLTGADAAALLPGDGVLSGKLTLDVAAEATGMSPIALIGALEGRGILTLANGRLARLNPTALEAVINAVDKGMPVDAARVRDRMASALAGGALAIRRAEAGISIEGGRARMLSNPELEVAGVDLVVSGAVNLAEGTIDARLTLSGTRAAGVPMSTRPNVEIALKGPIDNVKRTIDATAFANWLAVRAVEQQSKKLELLEGRGSAAGVPAHDTPSPSPPASPALPEPYRTPVHPR